MVAAPGQGAPINLRQRVARHVITLPLLRVLQGLVYMVLYLAHGR